MDPLSKLLSDEAVKYINDLIFDTWIVEFSSPTVLKPPFFTIHELEVHEKSTV